MAEERGALDAKTAGAVALACALLFSILFFIPAPAPSGPGEARLSPSPRAPQAGGGAGVAPHLDIQSPYEVDFGGARALWVEASARGISPAPELEVATYPRAPPADWVAVEGPWVGAAGYGALKERLRGRLRGTGRNLSEADWEGVSAGARTGTGRVLLVPSGLWPDELGERWDALIGPSDVVLVLAGPNATLDTQGRARAQEPPPWLPKAEGADAGGWAAGRGPNGAALMRNGRALDEWPTEELARAVEGFMLEPPQEGRCAPVRRPALDPDAREALSECPGSGEAGWARLVVRAAPGAEGEGRALALLDAPLPEYPGRIEAPASVRPGEETPARIRLQLGYAQAQSVRFALQRYGPDGRMRDERELGAAELGGARGAGETLWVASATLSGWTPGEWRLTVVDQYGRAYAQAAVHARAYSVEPLPSSGRARRFLLQVDGRPAAGPVEARRAGRTEWAPVPLHEGVAEVAADWRPGPQRVEWRVEGERLDSEWEETGGPWALALRILIPGLLLAGLVLVWARARRRPTWTVEVPEFPQARVGRREMEAEEFARLLEGRLGGARGEAHSADRLLSALHHPPAGQEPVWATPESVRAALDELVARGRASRWGDHYVLHARGGGEGEARRRAVESRLRERLMERGLDARGPTGPWRVWDGDWEGLERGELPRRLVFEDEEGVRRFSSELDARGGRGAARIRLARQTGRLRLVTADAPL